MGLLYKSLASFLRDYARTHGRGAFATLAKFSGIHPSVIARTAAERSVPTLETWEKLHAAFPQIIPPPLFEGAAQALSPRTAPDPRRREFLNPFLKPVLPGPNSGSFQWLPRLTEEELARYRAVPLFSVERLSPGGKKTALHQDLRPEAVIWVHEVENRGSSPALQALRVEDDSMEPTVPRGAVVVFDSGDVAFTDGRIYAVKRLEGDQVLPAIRRVRRMEKGKGFILLSDNRRYLPEIITGVSWARLAIGRVIWMWGKIQEA